MPRRMLAPTLHVTVRAPQRTPLDEVAAIVHGRGAWILRHQREFARHLPRPPPRQYVSGETHRYLGRPYRLKVAEGAEARVKLTRGWLWVYTSHVGDTERVKRLVEERAVHLRSSTRGVPYVPLLAQGRPVLTVPILFKEIRLRYDSMRSALT